MRKINYVVSFSDRFIARICSRFFFPNNILLAIIFLSFGYFWLFPLLINKRFVWFLSALSIITLLLFFALTFLDFIGAFLESIKDKFSNKTLRQYLGWDDKYLFLVSENEIKESVALKAIKIIETPKRLLLYRKHGSCLVINKKFSEIKELTDILKTSEIKRTMKWLKHSSPLTVAIFIFIYFGLAKWGFDKPYYSFKHGADDINIFWRADEAFINLAYMTWGKREDFVQFIFPTYTHDYLRLTGFTEPPEDKFLRESTTIYVNGKKVIRNHSGADLEESGEIEMVGCDIYRVYRSDREVTKVDLWDGDKFRKGTDKEKIDFDKLSTEKLFSKEETNPCWNEFRLWEEGEDEVPNIGNKLILRKTLKLKSRELVIQKIYSPWDPFNTRLEQYLITGLESNKTELILDNSGTDTVIPKKEFDKLFSGVKSL
jgi:hypothetical protein